MASLYSCGSDHQGQGGSSSPLLAVFLRTCTACGATIRSQLKGVVAVEVLPLACPHCGESLFGKKVPGAPWLVVEQVIEGEAVGEAE